MVKISVICTDFIARDAAANRIGKELRERGQSVGKITNYVEYDSPFANDIGNYQNHVLYWFCDILSSEVRYTSIYESIVVPGCIIDPFSDAHVMGVRTKPILKAAEFAMSWLDTYDTIVWLKNDKATAEKLDLEMEYERAVTKLKDIVPVTEMKISDIYEDGQWLI